MIKQSVVNEILGTWILESIFYKDANGERIGLYGDNPNGILMYDKHGYMHAQIAYKNRKKLSSTALKSSGSTSEKIEAFDTYMAYYGRYFETEPGTVIHKIEACLLPDWEGLELIRYCTITDDKLYIRTPEMQVSDIKTVIEVIWKRMV